MSSSEDSKLYIQGQLRALGDDVTIKKMMGEYILHYRGKVLGFISDDVLILEDGPTIAKLLPEAERTPLFPGSKDFVIFPDPGNSRLLCEVVQAIYEDLPLPKPRKKKSEKVSANTASKSTTRLTEERFGKTFAAPEDEIADFLEFHRKEQTGY